jgi:hypothetical protein
MRYDTNHTYHTYGTHHAYVLCETRRALEIENPSIQNKTLEMMRE